MQKHFPWFIELFEMKRIGHIVFVKATLKKKKQKLLSSVTNISFVCVFL